MQNIGSLAFLNCEGISRYLGAQAYGGEKRRILHGNENDEEAEDPHDWIERRIRDRRHKPI